VEGDPELTCSWVINAERPPPSTLASVNQNILHLFQVSLKGKGKESLPAHPWLPLSFLISSHLCFCGACFRGGGYAYVTDRVDSGTGGGECRDVLPSVQEDTEGLIRKVTLLEGELAEARQAQEVTKEKFCN
jgi:hypothetical protein